MGHAIIAAAAALLLFCGLARGQNFSLPTLPYPYDSQEPSIDAQTMNIHWTRHTNTYVTNLNNALATCPELDGIPLIELLQDVGVYNGTCATAVRNNAGGVYNHFLFFLHVLAPYNTSSFEADASENLKAAIDDAFGSFDAFKTRFSAAALSVFGSGWAWLCVPETGGLAITTTPNQDNPLMPIYPSCLPILGLDVWEHAYYLEYQNKRADYIKAFWNVVNWQGVSELFDQQANGTPVELV